MNKVPLFLLILVCSMVPDFAFAGEALRVSKINDDGSFIVSTADQYELAGIKLTEEGARLLPAILLGKDLQVEFESGVSVPSGSKLVYVFVSKREIPFPFTVGKAPMLDKILVNRFLVQTGAASIDIERGIKYLAELTALQETAKSQGEGLWSYEPIVPKNADKAQSTDIGSKS